MGSAMADLLVVDLCIVLLVQYTRSEKKRWQFLSYDKGSDQSRRLNYELPHAYDDVILSGRH